MISINHQNIIKNIFFLFLLFFNHKLYSQSIDSSINQIRQIPGDNIEKMAAMRQKMKQAFSIGDWAVVNAWLAFAENELSDPEIAALAFDERWLLYFWTNNFNLLLPEVSAFEQDFDKKYSRQAVPHDDLFHVIDSTSFRESRFVYIH